MKKMLPAFHLRDGLLFRGQFRGSKRTQLLRIR